MIELTIPLSDILIDPASDETLADLEPAATASQLEQLYAFLPQPVDVTIEGDSAHVVSRHTTKRPHDDTMRLYSRAVKHAQSGKYDRAIDLLRVVLAEMPPHPDASMAYLELGQTE